MSDDLLYSLLPAIHRTRDVAQGQPLRAFLGVVEAEYRAVHGNLGELYDAWFVETCAEWMLPYLGDRVGVRGLDQPGWIFGTTRARVANAVAHARRKGTAPALAGALRDATGWPARVLEGWQRLGWTQNVDDVRPGRGGTLSVSPGTRPAAAGTGFDDAARTVDLRRPGPPREADAAGDDGRWGLGRVAVFVWRLRSYPVDDAAACPLGDGRWAFHPTGVDAPLFHPPGPQPAPGRQPTLAEVPAPLTPEALRAELARGLPVPPGGWPTVAVVANGAPVHPGTFVVADLSRWAEPPSGRVAVDPLTGRLAFAAGVRPSTVRVGWAYGLSGDVGGGPYSRAATLLRPERVQWAAWVGPRAPDRWPVFATLHDALAAWAAQPAGAAGLIRLAGSDRLEADSFHVTLTAGQSLAVQAADGDQPCLAAELRVDAYGGGALSLNGLLLARGIALRGAPSLALRDCTVRGAIQGGGDRGPRRQRDGRVLLASQPAAPGHPAAGAGRAPARGGGRRHPLRHLTRSHPPSRRFPIVTMPHRREYA